MKDNENRPQPLIKEMPDQGTLEAFIKGLHGEVKVIFNLVEGRFEWLDGRKVEPPKTYKDGLSEGFRKGTHRL